MKITINKTTSSFDVRREFADSYDGLKIEFFHHTHEHEIGSPKKDMIKEDVLLVNLSSESEGRDLVIEENMSVNQVEDIFEKLGLHIQVFRKMNISWIETTATDSYTLRQQIDLSRESRGLTT